MNTNEVYSIETYLRDKKNITYTFRGVSMNPMLRQGRDLYTLQQKADGQRLKKYDVALYKRAGEAHVYVLHRIVEVLEDGYIFLGDNCTSKEIVSEDQVIAVMTEFHRESALIRSNRTISAEDALYKVYSRAIVGLFPARRIYRSFRAKAKKVVKVLLPLK